MNQKAYLAGYLVKEALGEGPLDEFKDSTQNVDTAPAQSAGTKKLDLLGLIKSLWGKYRGMSKFKQYGIPAAVAGAGYVGYKALQNPTKFNKGNADPSIFQQNVEHMKEQLHDYMASRGYSDEQIDSMIQNQTTFVPTSHGYVQ